MTSILRHVAEAFPPAMQETILNSHRVIGIATNTSMVLNCALYSDLHDDDSRYRTAGCSLMSFFRNQDIGEQITFIDHESEADIYKLLGTILKDILFVSFKNGDFRWNLSSPT